MLRKMLLSTSLFTLFAGCGGLQPDTVWQVSMIRSARPASCYVDGKLPTDTYMETGVQDNVGPFEMYEGPDSKMYLILTVADPFGVPGSTDRRIVEGTKGDSYSFTWTQTETNTQAPPISMTRTDTYTNVVTFKPNGDTFTGSWETKETHACSGGGCAGNIPNCDVTNQIKGRRIDVDRERQY